MSFETDSISVGELFSGDRFYNIPNYQRPFSWDEDNFFDLVSDIYSAPRNANYFLGTVVLYKNGADLIVVDGQQRITSLLILLACCRDSIGSPEYREELQGCILQKAQLLKNIPQRERLHVKDREIFNQIVLTDGGTKAGIDVKDLTEPANRYVIASEIFHERRDALSEESKVEFINFLTQNCVLIYLQAETFEEAFRLFEIVNDRGKQLRRIDVLKAHNLSPEIIASEAVRDQLARRWEENEESVGEFVFEDIFFLMRMIYVKDKPQGDLLSEFKDRIFDKGLVAPGEKFIEALSVYVDLYRQIFEERTYLEDRAEDFRFRSLIFIMDQEFRASEWRACLLSFAKKFGRDHFYEFCLKIEKLFLDHWINAVRKDERYADYTKILNLIDASKTPSAVIENVPADLGVIQAAIADDDLYGKGYAKYVLLRLELAAAEFDHPREFSAKSIEHVFPQNPEAGGGWDALASDEDRRKFVNKVGNLVLLNRGRNSSAGNREFPEKKVTYLAKRVSDYPRSIQVLAEQEWTPALIEARTAEAAALVIADP